jgi:PAS domain S-box-containing protein
VDDKRANLLALEATLESECNVLFARSGEEAISLLARAPSAVDLILMDVHMPGMDGFEATARIKQVPGCEGIPIVFITAVLTEDPFVKKGYEAGGIDYFTKPFNPDILKMKIAVYASYKLQDEFLKERERGVKESEELLRVGRKLSLLLEALPIGVLIFDAEGSLCQTTEEVARILGLGARAQDDDSYNEMLSWWDSSGGIIKDLDGLLARAIQRGESSHSERLAVPCADGTTKTVLISASPLHGLDARTVGALVLVQDLTASKMIEEELEQRVNRLLSVGVELEESIAH